MLEDLFQYIWKMKLFNTNNLHTTDGESITIHQVGLHNLNAGPDFLNAKIKIENLIKTYPNDMFLENMYGVFLLNCNNLKDKGSRNNGRPQQETEA